MPKQKNTTPKPTFDGGVAHEAVELLDGVDAPEGLLVVVQREHELFAQRAEVVHHSAALAARAVCRGETLVLRPSPSPSRGRGLAQLQRRGADGKVAARAARTARDRRAARVPRAGQVGRRSTRSRSRRRRRRRDELGHELGAGSHQAPAFLLELAQPLGLLLLAQAAATRGLRLRARRTRLFLALIQQHLLLRFVLVLLAIRHHVHFLLNRGNDSCSSEARVALVAACRWWERARVSLDEKFLLEKEKGSRKGGREKQWKRARVRAYLVENQVGSVEALGADKDVAVGNTPHRRRVTHRRFRGVH